MGKEKGGWSMLAFQGTAQGLVSLQLCSGCWWESANKRCLEAAENKKSKEQLIVLLLQKNHSTADRQQREQEIGAPRKRNPASSSHQESVHTSWEDMSTEKVWEPRASPPAPNAEDLSMYQASLKRLIEVATF